MPKRTRRKHGAGMFDWFTKSSKPNVAPVTNEKFYDAESVSNDKLDNDKYYDAESVANDNLDNDKYYDAVPATLTDQTRYSVIVSHNSRIQCLLANLRAETKKIRFQNCCVLKIEIRATNIQVSLLHSGEITKSDQQKSDKIFYCAPDDPRVNDGLSYQPDKFKKFEPISSDVNGLKRLGIIPLVNNYVFYLVRHGQSEHNEDWWLKKVHTKLDTQLLEVGTQSAQNAASAINRDDGNLTRMNMFFVSDLLRTRQTLEVMKRTWGWYDINSYVQKYMQKNGRVQTVVLPCASEVAGVGTNGDCDSSISVTQKMARENYPSCTIQTISNTSDCSGDWSTYLDFYGKKMRSQDDTFTGLMTRKTPRMRCRDTTLLAMAIYCLDFKQMGLSQFIGKAPSGGKKLKSKKRLKRR